MGRTCVWHFGTDIQNNQITDIKTSIQFSPSPTVIQPILSGFSIFQFQKSFNFFIQISCSKNSKVLNTTYKLLETVLVTKILTLFEIMMKGVVLK